MFLMLSACWNNLVEGGGGMPPIFSYEPPALGGQCISLLELLWRGGMPPISSYEPAVLGG